MANAITKLNVSFNGEASYTYNQDAGVQLQYLSKDASSVFDVYTSLRSIDSIGSIKPFTVSFWDDEYADNASYLEMFDTKEEAEAAKLSFLTRTDDNYACADVSKTFTRKFQSFNMVDNNVYMEVKDLSEFATFTLVVWNGIIFSDSDLWNMNMVNEHVRGNACVENEFDYYLYRNEAGGEMVHTNPWDLHTILTFDEWLNA